MNDDWVLVAIDQLVDEGERARQAISDALQLFSKVRDLRADGVSLSHIVSRLSDEGGRAVRLRSADAIADYAGAVARVRSTVIRSLVDDEGLTLTEAAALLGISRQKAGRLYHAPRALRAQP